MHDDRTAELHRLHASGCFVMPNPGGFLAAAREIAEDGTFLRFDGLPNVDGPLG